MMTPNTDDGFAGWNTPDEIPNTTYEATLAQSCAVEAAMDNVEHIRKTAKELGDVADEMTAARILEDLREIRDALEIQLEARS